MTLTELCAYISHHLHQNDIPVVLVGGACVSIYSDNKYQTRDLDFVQRYDTKRKQLTQTLAALGFTERNRYFVHPDTEYFLEFPSGPISVGDQAIHQYAEVNTEFGNLILLTATDICKDRLAAFYHWKDEQSLQQAINIAAENNVNMTEIKNWSKKEGMLDKFMRFESGLS